MFAPRNLQYGGHCCHIRRRAEGEHRTGGLQPVEHLLQHVRAGRAGATAKDAVGSADMRRAGTLAGVAAALRERKHDIKIGLADPEGAALFNYYANGKLESEGTSITEGIGQGRITKNLEGLEINYPYQIADREALPYVFDLLKEEGLCLGGSSGINVAGAVRMAQDLGPGHTIVTILCDYGTRYSSKLFNPNFLREKDLPIPEWLI